MNQRLITLFSEYVLNPAAINAADAAHLISLSNTFPYCQILHAFISRSALGGGDFDQRLSKTALYSPDRNMLHTIVNRPEALSAIKMEGHFGESLSKRPVHEDLDIHAETKALIEERLAEPKSSVDEVQPTIPMQPITAHEPKEEDIEDVVAEDSTVQSVPDIHAETKALIEERLAKLQSSVDEVQPFVPMQPIMAHEPKVEDVEDIVAEDSTAQSVPDIHAETKALIEERLANMQSLASEEGERFNAPTISRELEQDMEDVIAEDSEAHVVDEFESSIVAEKQTEEGEEIIRKGLDRQEVSKYDDDKMPYSFLWWLSKTRKEHSAIYQPYVKPESGIIGAKEHTTEGLSHQIAENIFYQQSTPLKDLENQGLDASHLTFKRKEEAVLDKFIQEDPQIRPPKPENLSIENKARQSAQDLDDLVSETLAEIYTGQMLFDKAIDTYKKLSLKFPEKSPYFAELIDALEKKLNK